MKHITEWMLEDLYEALRDNVSDMHQQRAALGHIEPALLDRTLQSLRTASEAIQVALDASEEVS